MPVAIRRLPMNAAPKLSWRALQVLDDDQVRHDQRHEQRERRSQLAEPRAQQQLDAGDERGKSEHARGERSLVTQSRAQQERAVLLQAARRAARRRRCRRASTTVSLIASSGQTAMSCAVLPKTLWAAGAHSACGLIEDSLTVALIVLERVAHRLDDRARRDRRAGECVEVAAVAPHGPALRAADPSSERPRKRSSQCTSRDSNASPRPGVSSWRITCTPIRRPSLTDRDQQLDRTAIAVGRDRPNHRSHRRARRVARDRS